MPVEITVPNLRVIVRASGMHFHTIIEDEIINNALRDPDPLGRLTIRLAELQSLHDTNYGAFVRYSGWDPSN